MEAYVARQPIFNKKMERWGYELLFRDGISDFFPEIDGDTATSKVLSNSFFVIGIDRISAGKRVFINFPQDFVVRKVPTMFPPERIGIEILEEVRPDEEVVTACKEMVRKGYVLALDDFCFRPELEPLIDLASIIKIDFMSTPADEMNSLIDKLSHFKVKLLAEKVETYEEFQQALDLGFGYFQGYFFSKPLTLKAKDISPSKLNLMMVMAEANREDFRFDELEKFISSDVGISYKLLRYINSAFFKRVQEISSIKHAIVLLGEKEVRRFVSLIAMAGLASDKPNELVRSSIIRARMCELLGPGGLKKDGSELFTVGLFSLIDAILDDSMENILKKLPLSERIKDALVKGEGELADYVNIISFYEVADWAGVSRMVAKTGIEEEKIPEYYLEAVGWADSSQIF